MKIIDNSPKCHQKGHVHLYIRIEVQYIAVNFPVIQKEKFTV
jgi:hypothetical protein